MPLLEARALCKSFPGVQALDNVSCAVEPGEVVAIVGENGAGKSTLMKLLAGIHAPDAGQIFFRGQLIRFKHAREAIDRGIVLIHQELNLAGPLSVAANLFLGRERVRGGFLGWLDRSAMARDGQKLLARVGLDVPLSRAVRDLPIGQQQLVEIARALALDAKVLIMDEPTSSLSQKETDRLFAVIAELKQQGVAVLYISHRLAEVKAIADRVIVLRDGQFAGALSRDQIDHQAIVQLMVGRELQQLHDRQHSPPIDAPIRLDVRGLAFARHPITFQIRAGEIVGMAGLVGAGRTELAESLFGIRRILSGDMSLDGKAFAPRHPHDAVARGLLLVPEDRRRHGLILEDAVDDNITLPNLDLVSRMRVVSRRRSHALAESAVASLRIKTPRVRQLVGLLSGGNQQKVVFGKWLARGPKVLILDEPTRGVDVGARSEIYALMDRLAQQGVGILMISSDMEEVLGVSDRVLVMHEGRIAGALARADLSEQAIMNLATGGAGA